jgi:phosphoribosylglycinamide formyltransferase 1
MSKIAIFASGSGSNAENIATFFQKHPNIEISYILTNKKDAGVLERASRLGIKSIIFDKNDFYNTNHITNLLLKENIDLVILAGFLWLVPASLVSAFAGKIINIHPALLPKYGGKGMYGAFVHEAVVRNGEKESGITIHYVNEHYDEGNIILQAKCEVLSTDTPDDVAQKVHALEYEHFPKVIAKLLGIKTDVL